jgi:hypothetical protein
MKKPISAYLAVLLFCFAFQLTCGASPQDTVWGPENQGLRMNLHIENADGNQVDVYKVEIRLANVSTKPIILVVPRETEADVSDYGEFFKKDVVFTSFPEVIMDIGQTLERISSQPTLEIKAGDSVTFQWVTAQRRLKPLGYMTPLFPSDGLYSIKARFLAVSKQGSRIFLYSNDCQLAIGGSTALPKFAVARIIQSDPNEGTVLLNLGSDQKIEQNDRFRCHFGKGTSWVIIITEVKPAISTGSVTKHGISQKNATVFPKVGMTVALFPVERH